MLEKTVHLNIQTNTDDGIYRLVSDCYYNDEEDNFDYANLIRYQISINDNKYWYITDINQGYKVLQCYIDLEPEELFQLNTVWKYDIPLELVIAIQKLILEHSEYNADSIIQKTTHKVQY